MNRRHLALTLVLLCASLSPTLAATREWAYPLVGSTVVQLVADDSGGCAALIQAYEGASTLLVWLDSKGKTIYQKPLPGGGWGRIIMGVNRGALVFQDDTNSVIVVERSGRESIVPGASAAGGPDVWTDRNGFFVMEGGTPTALVRYSY